MSTRLAIADDHLLVINGLKTMTATYPDVTVIFEATSGHELFQQLESNIPDLLLLDIQMPDMSGIDICKKIKSKFPSIRIIALTSFESISYVKQMMRNGADGYLLKNVDAKKLMRAIKSVMHNEQYIDEQVAHSLLNDIISGKKKPVTSIPLTKRETEILTLVAKELTNQEIADRLFISLRTVQTHRINLNQKLGVHNTAGLVNEAYKRGLI